MSRSEVVPFTLLYFRARGKSGDVFAFSKQLNRLLNSFSNGFLVSRVLVLRFNEEFVYIVPCFFPFPFVFWPLFLLPRIIYSFSLIVRGRRYSVRLWPIRARTASAALYEAVAK